MPSFRVYLISLFFTGLLNAGFTPTAASAEENRVGVSRIFEGDSGARLTIAPYRDPKEKTFLVKFENFNSTWDNKVILHHFVQSATNKKYVIRIKTGKKLRPEKTFISVVDSGKHTLLNGSIAPVVEVYLKGTPKTYLTQVGTDKNISQDILAQYQKQNFKVEF
jgi:hypothetical protein